MMRNFFLLSAVALVASAEGSTTTLNIMGGGQEPLPASILGSDATATSYFVQCPQVTDWDSNTEAVECGLGPGMTVIGGSGPMTTYIVTYGFEMTAVCSVGTASESALCTETKVGKGGNDPPGTYTRLESVHAYTVEITGGSVTGTDATATATPTGSGDGTSSGPDSGPTPTGGVARIGDSMGMILGGAVAAVMGAVL